MKTTIQVDDQLLSEVEKLADQRGQTMTAVIEEALRRMLAEQQQAAAQLPVELITVTGNGLQLGVNLDDSAGLLELMEKFDGST
jgi:hypothetical protein